MCVTDKNGKKMYGSHLIFWCPRFNYVYTYENKWLIILLFLISVRRREVVSVSFDIVEKIVSFALPTIVKQNINEK